MNNIQDMKLNQAQSDTLIATLVYADYIKSRQLGACHVVLLRNKLIGNTYRALLLEDGSWNEAFYPQRNELS